MKRNKSVEVGSKAFWNIAHKVIDGFPSGYDYEDPLVKEVLPQRVSGVCFVCGLAQVWTGTEAIALGRRSAIRYLLEVMPVREHAVVATFEDWWQSQGAERQEAMQRAFDIVAPEERLKHMVANEFPALRAWPGDPDHNPEASITLRKQAGALVLEGLLR